MASNSYKKYNDLGMTASEKAAENAMHMQMTHAQETIRKQHEQIQQLQKKQILIFLKLLMPQQPNHLDLLLIILAQV